MGIRSDKIPLIEILRLKRVDSAPYLCFAYCTEVHHSGLQVKTVKSMRQVSGVPQSGLLIFVHIITSSDHDVCSTARDASASVSSCARNFSACRSACEDESIPACRCSPWRRKPWGDLKTNSTDYGCLCVSSWLPVVVFSVKKGFSTAVSFAIITQCTHFPGRATAISTTS